MFSYLILCKNKTQFDRIRSGCRAQGIQNVSRSVVLENDEVHHYVISEGVPRTEVKGDFKVYRMVEKEIYDKTFGQSLK